MLEGGLLYWARTDDFFELEESDSSSLDDVEGESYLRRGGVGLLSLGGGIGLGVRGFLGCSTTGGGLGFSFSFLMGMGK